MTASISKLKPKPLHICSVIRLTLMRNQTSEQKHEKQGERGIDVISERKIKENVERRQTGLICLGTSSKVTPTLPKRQQEYYYTQAHSAVVPSDALP